LAGGFRDVQVCWEKFARYFDVELRQVPLEPGAAGMRPHQLAQFVGENTIGVVATFGVTYTCDFEPVAELAAELDRIQASTGLDVPVHVDAASGGLIAPFLQPGGLPQGPAGLHGHRPDPGRRDRRDGAIHPGIRRARRAAGRLVHAQGPGPGGFSLYDLSEQLRMRGWQVPAYPLPPAGRP
jgi:glutamate/tyrosine decarboxylase-like PLP-dependent enzyme